MSRHLRFIPDGGALVEVTCRTVQGRLLLVPSLQLNDIILGVLGRAQRKFPVEIVAYVFASSHFHLLVRVDHAKQLSDFMCYQGTYRGRPSAGDEGKGWEGTSSRSECFPDFLEEKPMDKKPKKKPMFVVKETLVHLTPGQMEQVQGGIVGTYSCCDDYTR